MLQARARLQQPAARRRPRQPRRARGACSRLRRCRTITRLRSASLGLYALTQLAFASGMQALGEGDAGRFRARGRSRRRAACATRRRRRSTCRGTRSRASSGARPSIRSGIPALSARELDRLAVAYAPSFEIEIRGDHDRFGWLRWRRASGVPEVDAARADGLHARGVHALPRPGAASAGLHGLVSGTPARAARSIFLPAGWTAWSGA